MIRFLNALALAVLLSVGFTASCDSAASTDCHQGDTCSCSGAGACTWNCVDSGCAFTANGAGAAKLSCAQGGCTLTATGQGDVLFTCAGGGCDVDASGQGEVNLSCAGGGCATTCGGMGGCNTTECPTCTCDETALTAACSIQ